MEMGVNVINKESTINQLKNMIIKNVEYEKIYNYLKENNNEITYEEIVTQKILLKIYLHMNFSDYQKESIVKLFCSKFDIYSEELYNNWSLVKALYPLMNNILNDIKGKIVKYFDDSLSIFIFCMGIFVYENPDSILLPKNLIMNIASDVLNDDITYNLNVNSMIKMPDSIYYRRKSIIEDIYHNAIIYGVFYEQYDYISYMRSKVVEVKFQATKPIIKIEIRDCEYEHSIQMGSLYDQFIYYHRLDTEHSFIHKYYDCKVCKYCALTNQDDEMKELALELLNRQFKSVKTIDSFYLFTGTIPSYICSIISLLYTELVLMMLFSDDNFRLISKSYIKNNMLFGDNISQVNFDMCISLICKKKTTMGDPHQSAIPFFEIDNKVVVGKWMYDNNFSIVEEMKEITFNCRKNKQLGQGTEFFGKEVFEKLVKLRFQDCGWKVVNTSIKIKENKETKTDIDLLAFKDGLVIMGQIKVANCGSDAYRIWKAGKTIEKGIAQAISSENAVKKDPNLLYSILKKQNIVSNRKEISKVISIVITSSNYFSKIDKYSNIAVIGLELLDEWLVYTQNKELNLGIIEFLSSPFDIHKLSKSLYMTKSIIDTEMFKIVFDEFEAK
jgi:hypothetical protein